MHSRSIYLKSVLIFRAFCGAIGWGTALQVAMSRVRIFSFSQIDSISKFCISSSSPNHPHDQPIVTSYISLQYLNQVICIYQAVPHYLALILATCPAHTTLFITLLKWDKLQKTQQCCNNNYLLPLEFILSQTSLNHTVIYNSLNYILILSLQVF